MVIEVERPQWITDLHARANETRERIRLGIEEDRALAREKALALEWCRANGNPHIPPPPKGSIKASEWMPKSNLTY